MAELLRERDCDPSILKPKTIAFIGYGAQGEAQALNLRESGFKVVVGLYEGSPSWRRAEGAGLTVMTAAEAAKAADFIMVLAREEHHGKLWREALARGVTKGKTLAFAHGFSVHFGQVVPPEGVNVVLVSPKGSGRLVRSAFLEGRGVPCLVAIHQDATGDARSLALAYAAGIGGSRAGVLETSVREETETVLFGARALLGGGIAALIKTGFEVLVEAGHSPESAWFECVRGLGAAMDGLDSGGLPAMRRTHSGAAEYAGFRLGEGLVSEDTKKELKRALQGIQDGSFARDWILENLAGFPCLAASRGREAAHPAMTTGSALALAESHEDNGKEKRHG